MKPMIKLMLAIVFAVALWALLVPSPASACPTCKFAQCTQFVFELYCDCCGNGCTLGLGPCPDLCLNDSDCFSCAGDSCSDASMDADETTLASVDSVPMTYCSALEQSRRLLERRFPPVAHRRPSKGTERKGTDSAGRGLRVLSVERRDGRT